MTFTARSMAALPASNGAMSTVALYMPPSRIFQRFWCGIKAEKRKLLGRDTHAGKRFIGTEHACVVDAGHDPHVRMCLHDRLDRRSAVFRRRSGLFGHDLGVGRLFQDAFLDAVGPVDDWRKLRIGQDRTSASPPKLSTMY